MILHGQSAEQKHPVKLQLMPLTNQHLREESLNTQQIRAGLFGPGLLASHGKTGM